MAKARSIIFFAFAAALYPPQEAHAATDNVIHASQLQSTINSAVPADIIEVQNQTYPILIRTQNRHQAIFQHSSFLLNGNDIVLEGFVMQNSNVPVSGKNNRVIGLSHTHVNELIENGNAAAGTQLARLSVQIRPEISSNYMGVKK